MKYKGRVKIIGDVLTNPGRFVGLAYLIFST
jgi:hypothetical protein